MSRRLLKLFAPIHGNRSSATCQYRCGNACFHEVPNTTSNTYFGDVVESIISRRTVLKVGAVVGATAATGLSFQAIRGGAPAHALSPATGLDWTPIAPSTEDAVVIPEGFEQDVVMRWGDKLFSSAPDFDPASQTAAAQEGQFGYNCDFLGFFDVDAETEIMMVNHEYTNPNIMFPGYEPGNPTREQVEVEWAAHGLSVVAVKKTVGTGELTPIVDHELNRRFTATSDFEMTGPAAGHDLLKTSADPTGTKVKGTLNNCAGGLTLWGTWLTSEENFNQYFANAAAIDDPAAVEAYARYGLPEGETDRRWENFDDRFDLSKEPNEANRFGWMVEVNPWDPTSTPKKRTAMGRFKHEAGNMNVGPDGRVAVYMGDDERFDYVYKFVSDAPMEQANAKDGGNPNADLLDHGTLYVARFTGDSPEAEIDGTGAVPSDGKFGGTGEWIKLVHGDESFVPDMTAAEVLIHTRQAADKMGATKMDRPEDIEPSPMTGHVFMAMTNNTKRTAADADEANPRGFVTEDDASTNKHGHVIELIEDGDDATAETFTWEILLLAGDPNDPGSYYGGFDKSQVSPISCPDNLTFDEYGNLWISTDGNKLDAHDGLYAVPLEGEERGRVMQFLSVPIAAETCGPWVTPERVNVAVQHPGEDDEADFDTHVSTWPDGDYPRPSIVTVWRTAAELTPTPSQEPTATPSAEPTATPSQEPSSTPSQEPSTAPSSPASSAPAEAPSSAPADGAPAPVDGGDKPGGKLPSTGATAGLFGAGAAGAGALGLGARLLMRNARAGQPVDADETEGNDEA